MRQVRSAVLVGRDDELRLLEEALPGNQAQGQVVVVSGEAGIGKTRLVEELSIRASARGLRVVTGRATADTSRLALRPFGEAFYALIREHGAPSGADLSGFRTVLAPFVPSWGDDDAGVFIEPSLVLLEGIHRLLAYFAQRHGLLLVLEDLQWADAETLATVEYLADNLRSAPILCLCTERAGVPGGGSDQLARLVNRRAATRIHLERLTDGQVEEMARAALGTDVIPAPVLGPLRRRSEGVPFMVEEMLSTFLDSGGTTHSGSEHWLATRIAGALPPSFKSLVRERMAGLDEASEQVVRAAAVLGGTFELSLLPPITDLAHQATLRGLKAALSAHLLEGKSEQGADAFTFRHALMREAVLAEMLPPERNSLSQRAADVIEDHRPGLPGEWCERAAELREQAGDALGACRLLQESARRALRRGALESAEATLERARSLVADDYFMWFGVDELLIEVLSRSGKTADLVATSRRLIEEWERVRQGMDTSYARMVSAARHAQLHLKATRAGLIGGDLAFARESLEEARSIADDDITRTRAGSLGAAVHHASGDLDRAFSEATASARAASELGLRDVNIEALETLGRVALERDQLTEAGEVFEQLVDLADGEGSTVSKLRALIELGALQARQLGQSDLLEGARTLAHEAGAVTALTEIDLEFGWLHTSAARLDKARPIVEEVVAKCRRFELPLLADAMLARSAIYALKSAEEAMLASGEETLSVAAGRPDIQASLMGDVYAVLAAVEEDRPTLRRFLDEAVSLPARWRRGRPAFIGLRVLACAIDGETPDEEPSEQGNHVSDAYSAYAGAIVHGRLGEDGAAIAEFRRADGLMPRGWRSHHARRLVAEAAIDDGWGDPVSWLGEGLSFFESAGLARLTDACRKLLRRAGAPVPRPSSRAASIPDPLAAIGVTPREMDVLLLVAEGMSDREIADRLFLSPRTIETHVKSLMRKSLTTKRTQLVAYAARHLLGWTDTASG